MRVKPCAKEEPGSLLVCDFCGTRIEFLEGTLFVEGTSEAAICYRCVDRLFDRLQTLRAGGVVPAIEKITGTVSVKEKNIEDHLYRSLVEAGLTVERQKRTLVGIADLVVEQDAVIEVKVSIKTRREFHQAAGQAKAYAEALGLPRAFVAASEIAENLRGSVAMEVALVYYDEALPLFVKQEA